MHGNIQLRHKYFLHRRSPFDVVIGKIDTGIIWSNVWQLNCHQADRKSIFIQPLEKIWDIRLERNSFEWLGVSAQKGLIIYLGHGWAHTIKCSLLPSQILQSSMIWQYPPMQTPDFFSSWAINKCCMLALLRSTHFLITSKLQLWFHEQPQPLLPTEKGLFFPPSIKNTKQRKSISVQFPRVIWSRSK